MSEHPFKPILLDLLHEAQLDQDAFLQKLNSDEYEATGTPELWSAKDHMAHMTFWRKRLVAKLTAFLNKETLEAADYEQLNPVIFEEQRYRSWADILAESEQAFAELYTVVERLTEEALANVDDLPDGEPPLYAIIFGSSYEHSREHFAQYYHDRHDLPQATSIYESWTDRVVQTEVPDEAKGQVLYNLACFYALDEQLEKASATLQQALTLAPRLREWSLSDPDLVALRNQSTKEE